MALALISAVVEAKGLPVVKLHDTLVSRELMIHASEEQYDVRAKNNLDLMKEMDCYIAVRGSHNITLLNIFKIIDKTIGLRVPAEVEIDGLDIHEHGLASAYAGFSISDANAAAMTPNENTDLGEDDPVKASATQMSAAVPVVSLAL